MPKKNIIQVPVAEPLFGKEEKKYINQCIDSGWVSSSGSFVTDFEKKCSSFSKSKYAIATSNGTTALHLALLAAGIKKGDEVIVPTLTFISTANAVRYTGAKPIFIDSQSDSWNIDPSLIEESITKRTKAIIPVHLFGLPADMDPIMQISKRHNLIVIEDAAEAQGALYKGKPVGSIGHMGTFSFYGNKIITTGEGGMVLTKNKKIQEKIRVLRDHGMSKTKRYVHEVLGYNYRLTNIQAALGVAQMEKINKIIDIKIKIANRYISGLKDCKNIHLPIKPNWAKNVFWLFSIILKGDDHFKRDRLIEELRYNGIDSRPMFPSIHTQPIYNTSDKLPIAERLSKNGISLPSSPSLKLSEIDKIISIIKNFK